MPPLPIRGSQMQTKSLRMEGSPASRGAEEDKRKAAEEEAVNDQYCLYSCALLLPHVVPRRSSEPAGAAGCALERVRGGVESGS